MFFTVSYHKSAFDEIGENETLFRDPALVFVVCVPTAKANMTSDHEADSLRHRRTRSVTAAEDIQKVELNVRRAQPDHP